jgi:SepF-like predicted cell division protein (DUF552 family)
MSLKIFSKREPSGEEIDDYFEVDSFGGDERAGALGIRIEKLNAFEDTERILRSIREGHIVFLKIKGLKEKDIGELKRCIERLKKSVIANNGDIVGVEQDWLILTPERVRVHRE